MCLKSRILCFGFLILVLFLVAEFNTVDAKCTEPCKKAEGAKYVKIRKVTFKRKEPISIKCNRMYMFQNKKTKFYQVPSGIDAILLKVIRIGRKNIVEIGKVNCPKDRKYLRLYNKAKGKKMYIKLRSMKFRIAAKDRTVKIKFECLPRPDTLCNMLGGYCYDDEYEDCKDGTPRQNLCGEKPAACRSMCCVPDTLACNRAFYYEQPEPNSVVLDPASVLIEEHSEVMSLLECSILCCQNDDCCKAVYTTDSTCLLYSYVHDEDIPIPKGAVLIKPDIVKAGENIMGDLIVIDDKQYIEDAKVICEENYTSLAMPKTEDTFRYLTKALTKGTNYIIGVTPNPWVFVDGDQDGSSGFVLPKEPAFLLGGSGENWAYLSFVGGRWRLGDGFRVSQPYVCQTK